MKRLSLFVGIVLTVVVILCIQSGCQEGVFNDPHLTAIPHTGPAPLTVQFKMYEVSDFETFEWIPGDGTSLVSNESDTFTHVYENPGTYYACCFVYDNENVDFDNGSYVKIVATEPGFSAAIETQSGITDYCYNPEGFDIGFNRDVSGGKPPYSFYWDFGDGEHSYSDDNPMYHHYFPDAVGDSYTVELTVTDSSTAVVYSNQIIISIIDCGAGP